MGSPRVHCRVAGMISVDVSADHRRLLELRLVISCKVSARYHALYLTYMRVQQNKFKYELEFSNKVEIFKGNEFNIPTFNSSEHFVNKVRIQAGGDISY